ETTVAGDFALLEVHGEVKVAGFIARLERGDLRRAERQGQDSVLNTVVGEDVGEGTRNEGAKAIITQGPHGMLPRRTAAGIPACQKDAGARVVRPVQREHGVELPVTVKAPIEEQAVAVAGAFRPLQELLGNDLI